MSLLSYFSPVIKFKATSPFNHDITVYERNGENRLSVNGIDQTGPYLKNVFNTAFKKFNVYKRTDIRSLLFLGVGGGCAVVMLKSKFPDLRITCVDIDPVIIDIAKKYFGLEKYGHLTFIVQNAKNYVKESRESGNFFDLVVIDLFIGDDVDDSVLTHTFLLNVSELLQRNGQVIINYQGNSLYQEKGNTLIRIFERVFRKSETLAVATNRVFNGYKK